MAVRMRGPWLAVAAMAAVVAVLLVVLLLRDDGVDVRDLLADAPAAVDAERTARLAMQVEFSGAVDLDVNGTGGVDFSSGAGFFDVDVLGQRFEMRSDPTTLFLRRAGDEKWVSVRGDGPGPLGSFGAGPGAAAALVDLLRGDAVSVDDLGHEEIAGGSTRHLRAEIDLDSAVAAAGEPDRAALEDLAELAQAEGTLPLEVWIDEQNRPVRQRVEGEVQGASLVVTVDLTDWGAPLEVAIPPEGTIREIDEAELALLFGRPAP